MAVGVGDKTIVMRGILVLALVAAAACLVAVRGAEGAGEEPYGGGAPYPPPEP